MIGFRNIQDTLATGHLAYSDNGEHGEIFKLNRQDDNWPNPPTLEDDQKVQLAY